MSRVRASLSHEERTVGEPRDKSLHPVILSSIEQVNDKIRLLKLSVKDKEHGIKVGGLFSSPSQLFKALLSGSKTY